MKEFEKIKQFECKLINLTEKSHPRDEIDETIEELRKYVKEKRRKEQQEEKASLGSMDGKKRIKYITEKMFKKRRELEELISRRAEFKKPALIFDDWGQRIEVARIKQSELNRVIEPRYIVL
jgi:organic radical activating enzyme